MATRFLPYGNHQAAIGLIRQAGIRLLERYKLCDTGRLVMTPLIRRFPDGSWLRAYRVGSEYRVEAFVPEKVVPVRRKEEIEPKFRSIPRLLVVLSWQTTADVDVYLRTSADEWGWFVNPIIDTDVLYAKLPQDVVPAQYGNQAPPPGLEPNLVAEPWAEKIAVGGNDGRIGDGEFNLFLHCANDSDYDFGDGVEGAANTPWTLDVYVLPAVDLEFPQKSLFTEIWKTPSIWEYPFSEQEAKHQQFSGTFAYWNRYNDDPGGAGSDWAEVCSVNVRTGVIT